MNKIKNTPTSVILIVVFNNYILLQYKTVGSILLLFQILISKIVIIIFEKLIKIKTINIIINIIN